MKVQHFAKTATGRLLVCLLHQKSSSSMSGDGHGHGHGHGHRCGCEEEHEPSERGLEYGLYSRIDLEKMQCLNESRDGDGKVVFKPWDQRNERSKVPPRPP